MIPIRKKRVGFVPKRKKFIGVSCSHGQLMDQAAARALLKFKHEYKPDTVIHLGDWCDTAAWRAGAKSTPDEVASVSDDIQAGLQFLEQLEPTLVFNGNHEHRIWKAAHAPNAIIAHAAAATVHTITDFITQELKADYVDHYVLDKSWRRLGNYLVGHGFFFNQHATKKHADKLGNCIFGHLHRQEVVRSDTGNCATGVCVGYLGRRDLFTYADLHESRWRWSAGWVYGEYTDTDCQWQLHRHEQPENKREYETV